MPQTIARCALVLPALLNVPTEHPALSPAKKLELDTLKLHDVVIDVAPAGTRPEVLNPTSAVQL